MKSQQCIINARKSELLFRRQSTRDVEVLLQRVDHYVSHKTNSFRGNAFGKQVLIGVRRRGEKQVGDLIRKETVDLLRHRAIAAAQAGLNVCDLDSKLHADEGACDGGVHIAHYQYPIRFLAEHDGLEALHDSRSLRRM